MINRFVNHLRLAMIYRRQTELPNITFIVLIVTTCTLGYILLAIISPPSNYPRDIHFVSERGAITVLSAVFLSMSSAFSAVSAVMLMRAKDRYFWVWIIISVGLAFLVFDELFIEIHK